MTPGLCHGMDYEENFMTMTVKRTDNRKVTQPCIGLKIII